MKIAQQYFQLVGSSASECDTIPGRQCMASCFFLLRQFEDVLIYLSSIKSYFFNDDSFNFNFAQVCLLHNLTRIETSVFGVRLFSIILEVKLRIHRILPSCPLVHLCGMQVTSSTFLYLCCFPLLTTACNVHSSGPSIQKIRLIQNNPPRASSNDFQTMTAAGHVRTCCFP